jgi:hypothetical protein
MRTKSGILELGKREREALKTLKAHILIDISYNGGGTFFSGDYDNTPDKKEEAKALLGIDVIDFILKITK